MVPLSMFLLLLPAVDALMIGPPASSTDYRQIASLLASTFDAPPPPLSSSSSSLTNQKFAPANKIEAMQWMLYEKSLTEQYTYNQYLSTTRKMRGKKYALFVAKEYIPPSQDNDHRASYHVVGMVEMGVTVGPVSIIENELVVMSLRPRATVGVLCVSSSHQNQGIGQALVEKCEDVAKHLWNETRLYVEVEPCNGNALKFFEKYGYEGMNRGADGGFEMRNATVARRRKVESRPHFVLEKEF
jgi:ribosomal protein S18 acetylase RimI-like enzyme